MVQDGDKARASSWRRTAERRSRSPASKGSSLSSTSNPKDTRRAARGGQNSSRFGSGFSEGRRRGHGVSPDSAASHQKFPQEARPRVRLAADTDKAVVTAYGVWVEKSMYGRKYMGVERSTFPDRQAAGASRGAGARSRCRATQRRYWPPRDELGK